MKKHGITVDCKHCICISSDNRGVFDITVPIIDDETGNSNYTAASLPGVILLNCWNGMALISTLPNL